MLLQDAMISEILQSKKPGTYGIGRSVWSGSIELSKLGYRLFRTTHVVIER